MVDETQMTEQNVDTSSTNQVVDEKQPQTNPEATTQDNKPQVAKPVFDDAQKEHIKELMRRRVERSHNAFFNRYGVKDLNGLDELFGKSRKFDEINQRVEELTTQNAGLSEQLAFIRNNINPDKYDDIRRYFKGGDITFNEGTLIEALPNHPEWLKVNTQPITPKTTIQSLSPNRGHVVAESDEDKMARIYGL